MCDKHYLVNAAFVDRGARPDPDGACPAYQQLPVRRRRADRRCSRPRPSPAQQPADAIFRRIGKPLGSWFGLTFGPQKPAYQAFTLGPATPANAWRHRWQAGEPRSRKSKRKQRRRLRLAYSATGSHAPLMERQLR